MIFRHTSILLASVGFSLASGALLAGVSAPAAKAADALLAYSFEEEALPDSVLSAGAPVEVVSSEGVTDGGKALQVAFPPDAADVGVLFQPAEPWDTSALGDCRFTFDATNTGESSLQLRCDLVSGDGVLTKRAVCLPAGKTETLYFPLTGAESTKDNGMRDDPPALVGCGVKMTTSNAKQRANYSKVRRIKLYVSDAAQADVVVLDNLRFASNPPTPPGYLEQIVDPFGQSTNAEFDEKVGSEQELRERADAELAELASGGPLSDRSRFGGWKNGPKLRATGYFRTEKVGDRWALVDPEGYLYFASGIANLRMANTSTFTGLDFRDDSVRYRDPKDVTPEDSIGIVPTSAKARKTAYVAYPGRRKMFTWLPTYDDPLANFYGYRRSAHLGPFPHGEVFSFYLANLARRYGEPTPGHSLAKWREVTVDRMLNWGFTSLGNWTDAAFYQNDKIPYFANGWIIGDFKTVRSGFDYWGPLPDPFDPLFKQRAEDTIRVIAEEVKGSPWCVGVFVDNEKGWGNEGTLRGRFGVAINALAGDAKDSPTKQVWVDTLREKYTTIDRLNEAWGVDVGSWDEFAAGFPRRESYQNEAMLADFSMLMQMFADEYFKTVHDTLEKHLPNHLYLGCRMTVWGMTPETRRAAAKYSDVMSYNFYKEALGARQWGSLADIDKPSIIGEFHMGTTTDTGLPNPGLTHAADQEDRGRMFTTYMNSVIDNPYFVGAHWFQYIDSPITGRAHDGENYNVGFVTTADVPYKPLVDAARKLNKSIYERRFGDLKKP